MDIKKINIWIDWLRDHGIDVGMFVAGIFGSLLRVSTLNEKITWRRKLILLISGGGTSAYITPLVSGLLNLGENAQFGISFIIGVMGMNAVDLIIGKIKNKMQ